MAVAPRPEPNTPEPSGADERWDAFEAFVREQHPALCAYAYRYVRARETAEEVVQDVLLRVWRRRDRMAQVELVPYVYRSVAHAAISRIRHERAVRTRDLRLQLDATEHARTDQPAALEELEGHVRQAIDALPERCRLVFLLSRDTGLSYPAIAERLGISIKTVENQIVKALRMLRAALKPHLVLPLVLSGADQLFRSLL